MTSREHGRQRGGGGGFPGLGHKVAEFYRRESWAVGSGGRLRNRTRWEYAQGLSCLFPYAVCGEGRWGDDSVSRRMGLSICNCD